MPPFSFGDPNYETCSGIHRAHRRDCVIHVRNDCHCPMRARDRALPTADPRQVIRSIRARREAGFFSPMRRRLRVLVCRRLRVPIAAHSRAAGRVETVVVLAMYVNRRLARLRRVYATACVETVVVHAMHTTNTQQRARTPAQHHANEFPTRWRKFRVFTFNL